MTTELYILLGTNLGERNENLKKAGLQISLLIGNIIKHSKIYETGAWGITDQPSFLNQVLQIETKLSQSKVLKKILEIELEMGRVRVQKWGSRLIDIDILYFDDKVTKRQNLIIPHPLLQERRFTLIPLTDIAPNFIHPIFKKTNTQLLFECLDKSEVKLINF